MAKKDRAAFGGLENITIYNTNAATNGTAALAANGEYQNIPVDKLKASPFNEGMPMDEAVVQSYIKSMKENGLLQPISVYDLGDGTYEIISGHQRLEAWCRRLKHPTIPAVIRKYEPDVKKRFAAHTEANTRNRNLDGRFWCSRIAEAKKVLAATEGELTRADEVRMIGEMLGIAQAQIYRYEQFGALIPELQKLEADGTLTVRKAVRANGLDAKQQAAVVKAVEAQLAEKKAKGAEEESSELSAVEFESIINTVKGGKKEKEKTPKRLSYADKTSKAGDGFMQMIAKSKTTQEKKAALAAIDEMRKKLDEAEKKLRESIK